MKITRVNFTRGGEFYSELEPGVSLLPSLERWQDPLVDYEPIGMLVLENVCMDKEGINRFKVLMTAKDRYTKEILREVLPWARINAKDWLLLE